MLQPLVSKRLPFSSKSLRQLRSLVHDTRTVSATRTTPPFSSAALLAEPFVLGTHLGSSLCCHVDIHSSCDTIQTNHIQQHCTMRTSNQKQNKGYEAESGVQQVLPTHFLTLSLFLLDARSLSFFWTRNGGPRTGSRQRKHSTAVRITVTICTTVTKLIEDCEKETQTAGKTIKQDSQQTVTERERDTGTKPLLSCKVFRRKANLPLCASPSLLETQRDFHVSALCVEDPSPPSTPPFDATNRRRHRCHPGHRHNQSPHLTTHQLLLHFGIVNPSRTSGSIIFPSQFRRRAQPNFRG